MIRDYDIVCFAPSDWWGMNPSCTTHIMQLLARGNRVLYINPFSSDLLGGTSRKGLARRLLRKLRSLCKWLKRPQKNLFVFSPVFLPLQGKRIIDRMNNGLLRLQIGAVCRALGMSRPILWVENLRAADTLDWFRPLLTVYHVSDLFTDCTYTRNRQVLQERERKITCHSDIQICVSKELHRVKSAQSPNVFYLPHGVDFELFRRAAEGSRAELPQLRGIRGPIAGYFGTLTALNDIELVDYCAERLPHVSFVLAGQVTGGDYDLLSRRPNVHLIGKVPYEQIPSLCASFDVCLLNWKMSPWIRHCNPLKFFEYMASGRPIVSVPIAEIEENYADLVSIAGNHEEFCNAIRRELEHDTPERMSRRIVAAQEHSWTNHVEKLSAIIQGVLAARCDEPVDARAVSQGDAV
jgi:glycosyltransferase involved in cell wall biosynthesis